MREREREKEKEGAQRGHSLPLLLPRIVRRVAIVVNVKPIASPHHTALLHFSIGIPRYPGNTARNNTSLPEGYKEFITYSLTFFYIPSLPFHRCTR